MAARALSPFARGGPRAHFVSNVDGADIARHAGAARSGAHAVHRVVEDLHHAGDDGQRRERASAALSRRSARRRWPKHFAAVSTRLDKVAEFGIDAARVFGFWDWVGGRYSLWSAIGLSLVIAIGPENFTEFLRGGFDIDEHFRTAPLDAQHSGSDGPARRLASQCRGRAAHAVIPYDQRLARFPAYLQQLDMESNGKSVSRDGADVALRDRADHLRRARHQRPARLLPAAASGNRHHADRFPRRGGADATPTRIITRCSSPTASRRAKRLCAGARWRKRRRSCARRACAEDEVERLAPHKVFPGDRPTSTLLYRKLDPRTLGRLVALYEHKVFVQSVIWDINPFDQWGVELGKELATSSRRSSPTRWRRRMDWMGPRRR